ncbi:uncharacterized protein LOC143361644 [Halictus rubicundus]|uniref:uncharacterized protein LOC143361644 n=1 Tax=Halictus rubicundus TaxID=77578 RepID=UPI004036DB26
MELMSNWSAFWMLVVTVIVICLTKVITVIHHQATYWKKRGVPDAPNETWRMFFRRVTFLDVIKNLYNCRTDLRYIGVMDFTVPTALIRDPELIKELGIKQFDHFTDHRTFPDEKVEPLFGKNVFSLKGDRWKKMRNTLSPFFTSSKMKFMFGLVSKSSHEFFDYLYSHPELCSMVDAKQTFTIFTNDVIATSAYGISVNTLKDRDNEFYRVGTKISRSLGSLNIIKLILLRTFPRLSKMVGLTVFPPAAIDFIRKIIRETVKKREELGIVRPDMIHLLMQARDAQTENKISLDDMVAQAFGFFIAGFDTVSTAMSFMTLELANHRDIQDKLREEVDCYLAEDNGEISYEALSKMEYLDMVVSETLRKYPIIPFIDRVCVQQYELPPAAPGYKSTTIYPGQNLWFPASALHYDPQYFPDPEKFDPERFSEENKKNIVPCTYMPFGLGPRMCIANRFALMEIKIMIVYLMQKFVIEPNEKTKPLVSDRMNFQMQPIDGFWYTLRKRDDSPLVKKSAMSGRRYCWTFPTMEFASGLYAFGILVVTLVVVCLTKFATLLYQKHTYWKRHGVPNTQDLPNSGWRWLFPRVTFLEYIKFIYTNHTEAKYFGIIQFLRPTVVLKDPELIKDIAIKHFDHFTDHRNVLNEEQDPIFGSNLFSLTGNRWRKMRNTLSPFFTSSKMRFMYGLVSKCSHDFFDYLHHHPELCSMVDGNATFKRFTNDVIATSAFGISVNSLKDRDNEFYRTGIEMTNLIKSITPIKFMMLSLSPRLCKMMGVSILPKSTKSFFRKTISDTVRIRKEQGIVRPDMIHLLMQAKEEQKLAEISVDDIVAQTFIFFVAGFDTVSTMMSFMTLELAMNQDVQDKLREETDRYLAEENGDVTYEALSKMDYMEMVISETLRKYPTVAITDRVCVEKFELPPAGPGYKPATVYPGEDVWIPIQMLHWDPKYFPDPERFDPERFSEENKKNIVPYSYLPFGLGPRMCVGNRFALMEVKIMMVHLLQRFVIEPNEKTKPVVSKKNLFQILPDDGFWYTFRKRDA